MFARSKFCAKGLRRRGSVSWFRQRATVLSALITFDRERVDGIARMTRGGAVAS